jgi:hypothetical protein
MQALDLQNARVQQDDADGRTLLLIMIKFLQKYIYKFCQDFEFLLVLISFCQSSIFQEARV